MDRSREDALRRRRERERERRAGLFFDGDCVIAERERASLVVRTARIFYIIVTRYGKRAHLTQNNFSE